MAGLSSAAVRVGPLVEREAELAAIGSALDAARAGAGSVVLIEGPAGIGKSALVAAVRRRAADDGMRVLHGRATEFEREFPFGVVQQCLEPVVRREADRERLLQGAARLVAPLLGGGAEPVEAAPVGLLHGLYWLAANVSDEAPVALVIDDAHWADEPSLLFLAYLARRVESLSVAVVIAARRDDDPAGAVVRGLAEIRSEVGDGRLEPRPLGPEGVARLLRELDAGPVDEAFASACHAATGGSPFLLGELLRSLVAEGVPFTAASAERVNAVAPATVVQSVGATLARLGTEPAALARAAAVLGDGTSLELAAQLARPAISDAPAAAAELVRAGLLQDARELRFRHPILAGAVLGTLSAHERASGHAQAARFLRTRGAGPERVALQLLHAAPSGDPQVVAELRRAAEHAHDRGAPATAVVMIDRALEEPLDGQLRGELLLALGRAELATGTTAAAAEHLLEAHRCATDPVTRGVAVTLMGATPGDRASRRQIVELAEAAVPQVEARDPDLAMRLRALVALDDTSHDLPEPSGSTVAEASFLGHLVFARMRPGARGAEVANLALRAAGHADALLEEGTAWLGFTGIALGLQWTDHLDEADRLLDRAIAVARRRGSITDFASALTIRAQSRRRAGRLRDAEADARIALDALVDPDWAFARGVAPLACTLVDQGRADDAAGELSSALTSEEILDTPPMLSVLLARMWVRAARREHAAALRDWEEALRRAEPRGANAGWIEDFAVAADLHAAVGDRPAAQAGAARVLELAEDWGTPRVRGMALHMQARVGHGDIELLRSAADLLAESPARLEEARARVSLGAALRRAGHRKDSREPLREGFELARRCGAAGLAETARSELRASGVRVRAETAAGADALTPSERRIADMAASGRSNPEIAQELFLTVKTIEMHLTRAYRKLDIRRRAELAQALAAQG